MIHALVCKDLDQVAKSILTHSFAICKVDEDTHKSLRSSWKASNNFLSYIHNTTTSTTCTTTKTSSLGDSIIIKNGKSRDKRSIVVDGTTNINYYNDIQDFQDKQQENDEEYFLKKYRRVVHGNLYGYNRPSDAKLLYRAFYTSRVLKNDSAQNCSTNTGDGITTTSAEEHQPWPDDYDKGKLRTSSDDIALKLHYILIECIHEIRNQLEKDEEDKILIAEQENRLSSPSLASSLTKSIQQPTRKRKLDLDCCALDSYSVYKLREQEELMKTANLYNYLPCPLDYFLYHNMNPNSINCSEHIDRGVLICISLTTVQGLEVLSSLTNEWICPEDLPFDFDTSSQHYDQLKEWEEEEEGGCSEYICILSGDQLLEAVLKGFVKNKNNDEGGTWLQMYPGLLPCRHRVKNQLCRSRLSISYELRMSF